MGCVTDTATVDLEVSSGLLSANVKVSSDAGNQISSHSDGLFVAPSAGLPIGVLFPYGGDAAPDANWLLCDGAEVSRSTYAALYGVVGTKYGSGDGTTTFNLPDMQGRVPVGKGPASDVDTVGKNDGVAAANRRATKHRHTPHSHTTAPFFGTSGSPNNTIGSGATGVASNSGTATKDGGSGNANDPLDGPAYLVHNYIIRAQ